MSSEFGSIRTEFEVRPPEVEMGPSTAAQMNSLKTVPPPPTDKFIKRIRQNLAQWRPPFQIQPWIIFRCRM